jgi:hypothetical protein
MRQNPLKVNSGSQDNTYTIKTEKENKKYVPEATLPKQADL